jgi:hypothetical protein
MWGWGEMTGLGYDDGGRRAVAGKRRLRRGVWGNSLPNCSRLYSRESSDNTVRVGMRD